MPWSVPNHYLNQCLNIVKWTIGNKLQWNLNKKMYIFHSKKSISKYHLENGGHFCLGLNVFMTKSTFYVMSGDEPCSWGNEYTMSLLYKSYTYIICCICGKSENASIWWRHHGKLGDDSALVMCNVRYHLTSNTNMPENQECFCARKSIRFDENLMRGLAKYVKHPQAYWVTSINSSPPSAAYIYVSELGHHWFR